MTQNNRHHQTALTLIEVLIVIAIMVLLVAMLLPVLGRSRHSVMTAACAKSLRQVGIHIQTKAGDEVPKLPPASWIVEYEALNNVELSSRSQLNSGWIQPAHLLPPPPPPETEDEPEVEEVEASSTQGAPKYIAPKFTTDTAFCPLAEPNPFGDAPPARSYGMARWQAGVRLELARGWVFADTVFPDILSRSDLSPRHEDSVNLMYGCKLHMSG